jgi:hypothetical protein
MTIHGLATQGTSGDTHLAPLVFPPGNGAIKVFAGPREDPFFFDLVGFNRSIASGTNQFTGVDAFLGKIVNAMVLEFPVSMVFPDGACIAPAGTLFTTPCGVWADTQLANLADDQNSLSQVDRMGNPAVNTALIPGPRKDDFNFGKPADDPNKFAAVILAQILNLDAKFGTCKNGNTTGAAGCGSTPLLQCAVACNPNVPQLAAVAVPDVLRFASNAPDGYPNGRQLFDRTTDLLISLILQIPNFTDGTDVKQYCLPQPDKHGKLHHKQQAAVFPYLGPPLQLDDRKPFQFADQSCP